MSTEQTAVQPISNIAPASSARPGVAREGTPSSWPAELEFLAYCARSEIDAHAAQHIRRLARDVDWDDVIRFAHYHRVLPLLHQSAKRVCAEEIPQAFERPLHLNFVTTAALNLRLAKELHNIRRRLKAGGVDTIYFKGPVLAELAYGSLGLRACSDIDLLIRESDFYRAERLLREAGYSPAKSLADDGGVDPRLLRMNAQCPFVHPDQSWSIDVHTAPMPPGYSYSVDFETLYARSVGVVLSGEEARSFCAEDLIQILCLHGVKNRWEALKYVCDVAEVIRSQPGLNWDEVIRTARSVRGERILYGGLELTRQILGVSLPKQVVSQIERDPGIRELAGFVLDKLAHTHERQMDSRERLRFHLKIQDTWWTKIRYGLYVFNRRLRTPASHL